MTHADLGRATTHWHIDRWDADQTAWVQRRSGLVSPTSSDFARHKVQPYDTSEVHGNLITTAGLTRLTSLLTAAGGQAITNTSARIGVGNATSPAAAVGDTNLSAAAGSANRWFQIMDASFPQTSGGVLTLKSTVASADGNFAWNEFGIDIKTTPPATSGATVNETLFNHKTSIAQGTKVAGQTWAATATVTFS